VTCATTATSLSVSERYFSPNGDGQKDTTTAGIHLTTGDIPWTLNVRNAGGAAVRSWSGSGSCIYLTWDGRDAANAVQPDGDYLFEAINNNSGQQISTATATIDTVPPAVSIPAPANNQLFSNVRANGARDVTVTRSVSDAHLSSWTLLQSGNAQPAATIATGTTGASGSLQWHTDAIPNGVYSLTLSASDLAGNSASVAVNETVANFTLSQNVYQLDRSTSQTAAYASVVPFTMTETVTLKNTAGTAVRTLWSGSRAAGTYSDPWDGRNDQGAFVPDGPYSVVATVTDGANSMTWDESNLYRAPSTVNSTYPQCRRDDGALAPCADSGITFDPYTNKPLHILYCAALDGGASTVQGGCSGSAASLIQVKATSLAETPLSCAPSECVAQEYQSPGAHEVVWYGMSLAGTDISQLPRLIVFRRGDIWPKNVVFAYGLAPSLSGLTIAPVLFNPASAPSPLAGQQFSVTVSTANAAWTASLKAEFRNRSSGSLLRTITTAAMPAGLQGVVWDGRADNGALVAPGIYDVTLTAMDSIGGTAVLKPVVIVRY